MAGWSAALFCISILLACVPLWGLTAIPASISWALSMTGFVLGVLLLFIGPRPPF
jgi:hypothetical protein